MSPEQLESKETDFRTDVFAMGIVMYEMITGRSAFPSRGSLEAAIHNQKERPQPISQLQPEVPPEVELLISRCLARDPSERWQSMSQLLSQLKSINRSL
jgi:serine/threonine protein kinase